MASSTASAVTHYASVILGAYKRRHKRILKRRELAELELEQLVATQTPAKPAVVKKKIRKAAPSVTPQEIDAAIQEVRATNQSMQVSVEEVKKTIIRMMQEKDDEEALMALL